MNISRIIIHILLIGLLIHFVALTWLEYRMGLTGTMLTIVALWKEIIVVGRAGWLATKHQSHIINLRKSDIIFRRYTLTLFTTITVTMIVSARGGYNIGSYIAAFKYNLIGFGVGLLAYISGTMMSRGDSKHINRWYITVIKGMLVLSVIWYSVLIVKPGVLKYLGYSKYTYEGSLSSQPPAVYYSEMTSGIQRNQFVFERPITYGFRLVAFRPLFFVAVLRRKPLQDTWFRRLMYTVAIICTFSRAAWGVRLGQIGILGYRTYQNTFKQFARKILLPAIIVVVAVGYLGFHEIFGGGRQFSNTGHINALITSIHAIQDHWLLGRGPGSVGPASHHFGLGYNTENQFLQVWIEYGLVGFIGRLVLFGSMIAGGLYLRRHQGSKTHKRSDYLIAYSIGMIGLAVSGIVLHSRVDRMVVWPVAILIGMSRGVYIHDKTHNNNHGDIIMKSGSH